MHHFIIAQVLCEMGVRLPQRKFLRELFWTWFTVRGRFNYTNVSRYVACDERTLRRWFARGFDWLGFNGRLLDRMLPAGDELIAAQDASFVPKSGKHTHGLGYFFNGGASRSEKGLEVSLVSVVDVTQGTAYALSAMQTPPGEVDAGKGKKKKPRGEKKRPSPGKETADTRIDVYLRHFQSARAFLPKRVRHLAVDGYFAKEKFVNGVCALNMDVVGKLRSDASAKYLYNGPRQGRGRPKLYADKVQWSNPDMRRWKDEGAFGAGMNLYTAVLRHTSLKRAIRVAMLVETKSGRRALLFSTDTQLDARTIVGYYKARFQIEFLFRDAKQGAGLNHCQARNAPALDFHWNLALCAVNLAKWREKRCTQKKRFSLASCKQRLGNEQLLELFSRGLGLDLNFVKSHPAYQHPCNYGVILP